MANEPISVDEVAANAADQAAALAGDQAALGRMFDQQRTRLQRMVAARIDARLAARINASDVLQDVFVEAQRRIDDFDPGKVPWFIWLRGLAQQRMIQLVRRHVDAKKRTTDREVHVETRMADASTASLARFFADRLTTISQAFMRDELREHIQAALQQLDEIDREIISLRHYEQLSNEEAALILNMNASSASTRHFRALKKLRMCLEENPLLADYVAEFS